MLEAHNIRKTYPGTVALDDVSVRFEAGKVCALLGKNGAGKSTLVKILSGTAQPTSGELLINGQRVAFGSATDAFRCGIATVYQELSLIPGLTVAENVLLGRMPHRRGPMGRWMIDWPAARAKARGVLAEMGVDIDVDRPLGQLGVAQQQVVEIAKAMSVSPKVLMLDEPTSALARHETEMLFRVVRKLADAGVAIIYITHRLQELKHIADSVTVLRDGKLIGSVPFRGTAPDEIVKMIFGSVVQRQRPSDLEPLAEPLLEVHNLTRAGKFEDVSFTLRKGEVLGIAGMLGSGRTELLRAIFGADQADSGHITLGGKRPGKTTLRAMKGLGMGLIPENRKEQALVLPLSIEGNMALASLRTIGHMGLITAGRERRVAQTYVDRLAIKVASTQAPVSSLSGGNQQKVVVGKWLNTLPKLMLFDEPTRGIDLQAKQHIFQTMWDLSREGISSLFVSSELEELVEVCHRILIMKAGRIVGEVVPEQTTVEQLVLSCMEAA